MYIVNTNWIYINALLIQIEFLVPDMVKGYVYCWDKLNLYKRLFLADMVKLLIQIEFI